MREVLVRFGCLLFLWVGVNDLFIGLKKGFWPWTLGLIAAFFVIEGTGWLVISVYLKFSDKKTERLLRDLPD